jgi:membrane protease YdiL (CAAX protease family)
MMQEPPPRPDLGWSAPSDTPTGVEAGGAKGMHGGPAATWTIWGALGVFLANLLILQPVVSVVILLAMGVDQPASTDGAAGFPELAATLGADIATVIAIVIWFSTRHPGWVQVLGLPAKGRRLKEIAIAIGLGPLVYAGVAFLVVPIIAVLLGAIAGSGATTPDQIDAESLSIGGKVLTVVVAVFVAPITEELVFRGMLFRALRDRRGFWVGAIVSSLLFGMVHLVLPAPWQDAVLLQVTMVFTGMALAAIYEWRGNLVSCIVTHMSFNVVGVLLILVVAKGA